MSYEAREVGVWYNPIMLRAEYDYRINFETLRNSRRPRVTLLGSFRFKSEIDRVNDILTSRGIDVLAPPKGLVTGEVSGFPLIEGDTASTEEQAIELEGEFMNSLINSDAGLLVNPNQYNGITSAFELGFAHAQGIPLYALEPLDWQEQTHSSFVAAKELISVVTLDTFCFFARIERDNNIRPIYQRIPKTWKFIPQAT